MSLDVVGSPLSQVDEWEPDVVGVAVIARGGVVETHGPRHELFHWASLTKSCTAFTVLRLVDEGTLSLDELAGPGDRRARGSTIRHLLAHASGTPFEAGEPGTEVGHRRHYSNLAYVSLGRLVEARLGRPFADVMDELLLKPLGMDGAGLRGSSAGGLHASLDDLVRYCSELLDPTLISPALFAEATSCQFPDLGGRAETLGEWYDPHPWGLGFEIKGRKQRHWMGSMTSPSTFGHSGGSGSFFWIDQDAQLACCVLSSGRLGEWARAAWPRFSDDVQRFYSNHDRRRDDPHVNSIADQIPAIRLLRDDGLREAVSATWAEAAQRSSFDRLDDIPQSVAIPSRSLLTHVNDVNSLALLLIDLVERDYGLTVDRDQALAGAILHDVDKAFIIVRRGDEVAYADGRSSDDHGRMGADLAVECGVPDSVADLVRFHAPFNYEGHLPGTVEGTIVHYADLAAADFGAVQHGAEPIHSRSLIVKREPRFIELLRPGQ